MSVVLAQGQTATAGSLLVNMSQLQRKCTCGSKLAAGEDACGACQDEQGAALQTQLTLGQDGDRLEQDADRVAAQVLDMPVRAGGRLSAGPPQISRRTSAATPADRQVPDSIAKTLNRSGEPLPGSARAFFEPRFGHDFSRVRIHRDETAAASAKAVSAHAYTVANHLVFAQGRYAPETGEGRRLLAHELAHVVQQQGGTPRVQREGEDKDKDAPATKQDVSIVLTDEAQDMDEGRTYAKTALRVTSVDDAVKQLKALKAPVGTLFVVSHSSSAGQIQFVSASGNKTWVDIGTLADAMKGQVSTDTVDFRGCKLGSAQAKMEAFRKTSGAKSVKGSNCWTFVTRVTPLVYKNAEVTQPSQIPEKMKKAFDKALIRQINGLKAANNKPVKDCLLSLQPGERAGRATLNKIWQQYWANKGNLVASWGSPDFNEDWQKDSICSNHMTTSTKPCAIVEAKAPASGGSAQGGATGSQVVTQGVSVEDAPPASPDAVDEQDEHRGSP